MLKLHFAPSSRAGRVLWLLEELGLEYELNRMDFHPKDLKSDEHRARHPLAGSLYWKMEISKSGNQEQLLITSLRGIKMEA